MMDIYRFVLSPWFWLAAALVFSLVELATSFTLTTIWFAISALLMVFVSGLTEIFSAPIRFRLHLGIFLIISIVLLVFTRPIAIKKLKVGKEKTNIDSLIGMNAPVLKRISEFENGEIKLNGQLWTAKSENGETIEAGSKCKVIKIEGAHAVVGTAT
jgi:membrane protein implicated in regulation of membrane protease activity